MVDGGWRADGFLKNNRKDFGDEDEISCFA